MCVCIYIQYKWNRSNLVSRECLFLVGCRRLPLYGHALKHISIILLVYFVSIDSKFKTTRNILGKRKNQTAAKAQVHICISQKWLCCWCRLNIDNIPNHYNISFYHFQPLVLFLILIYFVFFSSSVSYYVTDLQTDDWRRCRCNRRR